MPPDASASTSTSTPLTIIDLHLLAALLLRERLHTPSPLNPLAHTRLAEICTGAYLPTVLPLSPHASRFLELDAPKVGYFCAQAKERRKHADNANVGAPALGPGDWLHKNLDGRLMFTLDEEGAEEAFGRTRLAVGNGRGNSVYVLALALQHVLDALPPHAARVRVRTADGLSFECGVGEFEWTQLAVVPREAVYVCHSTLAPPEEGEETVVLRHWVFGKAGEVVPWVYLTFKNPKTGPVDKDKADTEADDANMENETETDNPDVPAGADADDAVLDLSSLLLGSGINNNNARGPGGELFALVRARAYERVILAPRTATIDQERITSRRLAVEELRCKGTEEEARELAGRVLGKLGLGAVGAVGVVGAGEGEGKEDMGVNANRDVGMVEGADDPNPNPNPNPDADPGNAQTHPCATYLDAFCAYCGRAEPRAVCSRCSGPDSGPDSTSTSTTSAAEGRPRPRPRPRPRERYCGQACQRKAWRYHKPWCRLDVPPPPKPPAPPAPEPAPEPKPEEKDGEENSNMDEDSEGGEEDAEGENDGEDGEGEEEEEEKDGDGDGDGDGEKKNEKDDDGEAPKNGEDRKEGADEDVEMKDE